MRFIDAAAIRESLPWPRAIDALAAALLQGAHAPLRAHHAIDVPGKGPATLLVMPAWREGAYLGVKLVTVFPGNADAAAPSVAAVYALFDARDGRPLAMLDGGEITRRRTAAASALAARHLARADARHLVMVGAGHQAPGLVAAHASVRPIERVTVWSRTRVHAEATARELAGRGFAATATDDLERAVRSADIVSCATLSTAPLVHGAWLPAGVHLDLVGAFKRTMRETDAAAMRRADLLVVDDREAAMAEGGDIVQAIAEGAIDASAVAAELRALVAGEHPGRRSDGEVTVFKSVGFALEDLAAAAAVFEA